jgi:cytochrome c2
MIRPSRRFAPKPRAEPARPRRTDAAWAFGALLLAIAPSAKADPGADLYRRHCAVCHSLEPGENKLGPSLAGVVGGKVGQAPGYNYSAAMRGAGGVWDPPRLDAFLENSRTALPGNKMIFAAKTSPADRAAIIGFLRTQP